MWEYLKIVGIVTVLTYPTFCIIRSHKVYKFMKKLIKLESTINMFLIKNDYGERVNVYSRYDSGRAYRGHVSNVFIDLEEKYKEEYINATLNLRKTVTEDQMADLVQLMRSKSLVEL